MVIQEAPLPEGSIPRAEWNNISPRRSTRRGFIKAGIGGLAVTAILGSHYREVTAAGNVDPVEAFQGVAPEALIKFAKNPPLYEYSDRFPPRSVALILPGEDSTKFIGSAEDANRDMAHIGVVSALQEKSDGVDEAAAFTLTGIPVDLISLPFVSNDRDYQKRHGSVKAHIAILSGVDGDSDLADENKPSAPLYYALLGFTGEDQNVPWGNGVKVNDPSDERLIIPPGQELFGSLQRMPMEEILRLYKERIGKTILAMRVGISEIPNEQMLAPVRQLGIFTDTLEPEYVTGVTRNIRRRFRAMEKLTVVEAAQSNKGLWFDGLNGPEFQDAKQVFNPQYPYEEPEELIKQITDPIDLTNMEFLTASDLDHTFQGSSFIFFDQRFSLFEPPQVVST